MSIEIDFQKHPILLFDHNLQHECRSAQVTKLLINELNQINCRVVTTHSIADTLHTLAYSPNICCLLFDWDSFNDRKKQRTTDDFLNLVTQFNDRMPIYILTQKHEITDADYLALKDLVGFFWKYADTPNFVAGRIKNECQQYIESLYPPFFKALYHYSKEYKYAWHTPGHMGGVAFLKSPVGRLFYDFYGENIFRSDLSISVPELGSLMEHSAVLGEAEQQTAKTFGADMSFYVTNGTSTSNKIVVMSTVTQNDVVIVDRNCHKSLQHAITMANVIPIYFKPTRNAYGIIGGIPLAEFSEQSIEAKIADCPLIKEKTLRPKLAIITNSTYDGLIYNVNAIKDTLAKSNVTTIHFDEAWYPYAKFHPMYAGKYAMSDYHHDYHPTVFSTQSTHKLLAAFSQASMVHVKQGVYPIDKDLFNETFMMHTSTSPQYSIIASLDISTKMMSDNFGYRLVGESITEAIAFRQEFDKIKQAFREKDWFFQLWQPQKIDKIPDVGHKHFIEHQHEDASVWKLCPNNDWHLFGKVDEDFLYLDPIKVTVLTPGINQQGGFTQLGIPAPIVSKFLMKKGVVDEKTGFYSMLFLFSIGVNKSKAMTLLADLVHFKQCFDQQTPLTEVFPDLVEQFPNRYGETNLQQLADEMHCFLRENNASEILHNAFDQLPQQAITPNQAYQHIVNKNVTAVSLDNLTGKVIATMVAPYPPGIPVVMPGERLNQNHRMIINYLKLLQDFDNTFPGFENEVHGAEVRTVDGRRQYFINTVLVNPCSG